MTCRLPQTPRTPTTGAAHYFDEVFSNTGKPKKPYHLRRSSTARSIGHRTDWETSTNGDDDLGPIKRTNSIGYLNEEDMQNKAEMDKHVASYVSDQLERIKSNKSDPVDSGELETSLDGAFDITPRRRPNRDGDYFSQ